MSLQISIRRRKSETRLVGKLYALCFLFAIYVPEAQPDQATLVAHSPGQLSVLLVCSTKMAPTKENIFC